MDISAIFGWINSVTDFFNFIWEFVSSGIYQFFKDIFVILTKLMIYSWLQTKIFMLDVALEVVKEIVEETGIAALVRSAWSSIPADVQGTLSFFKIPQGLTLVFSAFPARWAMKFIPGA